MKGRANRLAGEKSPYLLQHARNPVDWWPWCEEAIRKAKNDGKPIFLSVGYSTCHWCHVFAHESFEDESIAALINKNFIPIKVDREEHPEVDSHYMAAVQAMTGQGGWPLSVFLTPDLRPFYGGTYFPPEPRYGMPSFRQVLEFVARLWKEKRGEVTANAERVAAALREEPRGPPGKTDGSLLEAGYAALLSSFDAERGGFGGAPKFPLPTYLTFLLRYHFRTGKEMALTAAKRTLEAMAAGGIRDHLGGGFHRYSTDRAWLVPHFEKMLYDNALLALAYLEAYQVTGDPAFEEVVRETLGWMEREMRGSSGGFYSAQDADTPDGEGVFYSWTPEEVAGVLGRADGQTFCRLYGITEAGNFEGGRTVLHAGEGVREVADGLGVGEDALATRVGEWRGRLYEARLKRARPAVDDKVLTSWNGLAISAFSRAGLVFGEKGFTVTATRAAEFVMSAMVRDGRLLRRYRDGEAAFDGALEDYAFFAQGLLDLFEATHEPRWLREAKRLMAEADGLFWDAGSGGYFGSADPRFRSKEAHDGPTPSGNSVAASNLMRIWALTDEKELRVRAVDALGAFQASVEQEPTGHTNMLSALDLVLNGIREVVVTSREAAGAEALVRAFARTYAPDAVLVVADAGTYQELSAETSLLEGREPGAPTGYVCRDFACEMPARDEPSFSRQLGATER